MRGKGRKTLAAAALLSVLLSALFYSFYHYNRQISTSVSQQAKNYLKETSNYSTTIVQNKIMEYFANTQAVAHLAAQLDSIDEIVALTNEMANYLQIQRLGYTYPDGTSYSSDGYVSNLSSRTYIKQALTGEYAISDVLISMYDGSEVFALAVPVRRDGRVVGVLHSTFATKLLHELVKTTAYEGHVASYVIGEDGYLICQPLDGTYKNVFDYLRDMDADMDQMIAIQNDLRGNRNGFVKFGKPGRQSYLSYHYMGINNWFLIHIVPAYIIDAQVDDLFMKSISLVMSVALAMLGIVSFFMYTLWMTRASVENHKNELEFINSNIQGGLYKCGVMGSGYFGYISDGFLRLTGYTREEITEDLRNLFMSVVYDEDKVRVKQMRMEAYESHSNEPLTMEYRIQRKDGSVIWVLDKGQFLVDSEGVPWFYSIMLDHTQQKMMIEELHYNEERYRIVAEQSSSVIFDYDYRNESIEMSSGFATMFGYTVSPFHFPESELITDHFHPEDVPAINTLFSAPLPSDPIKKAEVRLLKKDHGYIWCRITITTIFDQDGIAMKGIGRIVNIDSQKRHIDDLMRRAQMDELTGLYNKPTTRDLIETILLDSNNKEMHALMIIDLDDFKQVNDTQGHLIGDHVLSDIGQILKGLTRPSDIVGRMGGDEFVVFLRDIPHRDIALKRAKDICKHLELYQTFSTDMHHITCSIGIALAPTDATDYIELFTKADKALYKVKNSGKNRYYVYNEKFAKMDYVASRYASFENEREGKSVLKQDASALIES